MPPDYYCCCRCYHYYYYYYWNDVLRTDFVRVTFVGYHVKIPHRHVSNKGCILCKGLCHTLRISYFQFIIIIVVKCTKLKIKRVRVASKAVKFTYFVKIDSVAQNLRAVL
jgi:hypothetical protein